MKNKIFSLKLYLQGLKKIRAVGIASAICIIVLNAIIPIIAFIENSAGWPGTVRSIKEVTIGMFAPFGLLVMLFAPLTVLLMFSYLNERSKSDFYHSLPQTRLCVYMSFMAAVLTWLTATLIASALINSLIWIMAPYYHLSFISVLLSFIAQFILTVLISGFMCFAMMLTGTVISNVLIFALVALFVRTTGTMFIYGVEEVTPIFLLSESWLKIFSFEYFLPWKVLVGVFDGEGATDFGLLIYSLIIGILLLAASGYLYIKRRSEIAGQSAPNKILQLIYRSAVTLPFLLIIVFCMIVDGLESYLVVLFAIALLVYLLFELMTMKNIKSMFRSLKNFYIPVVAAFVFMCGIYITSNAIINVQPEPDEISGITILKGSNYGGTYEAIQTSDITVSVPEANEIISESLIEYINNGFDRRGDVYLKQMRVLITLDSGRKIGRYVYVTQEEYDLIYDAFSSSEQYGNALIKLPENREITSVSVSDKYIGIESSGGINAFWSSFVDEYNSLSREKQIELKKRSIQYAYRSDVMSLQVGGYVGADHFTSWYLISEEYTPKTMAAVALYVNNTKAGDIPQKAIEEYSEALSGLSFEKPLYYYHMNMTLAQCFGDYATYRSATGNSVDADTVILEYQQEILKFLSENKELYDFSDPDRKLYSILLEFSYETLEKGVKDSEYETYLKEDANYEYAYDTLHLYFAMTDEEFSEIAQYFKESVYR